MSEGLEANLENILGTLAKLFADEGKVREVTVLAHSTATIKQTDYDNWDGGQYGYTIYLQLPDVLYHQLGNEVEKIEEVLKTKANEVARLYPNEWVAAFSILTELTVDDNWREKARALVTGKGLTNQGRARSDNLAPRQCDGLLFRSQPEINLYRARKSLSVSFAPLPVFVRGGATYRRIEPDFVILKDGVVMIVEVDGDTVHRENPQEAHDRVTMLLHEGAQVERVNAKECDTPEKAKECAAKILAVINKHRTNK